MKCSPCFVSTKSVCIKETINVLSEAERRRGL